MRPVHTVEKDGRTVQPKTPVDSIWQMLTDHVERQLDKDAIITVDVATGNKLVLSRRELRDAVIQCANYLHTQFGVQENTHFGFTYDNRAEVLILSLAGALLGAASAPLDARRDVVDRMKYKLELTESHVLITHPRGSYKDAWQTKVKQFQEMVPSIPVIEFNDGRSLIDEIAAYDSVPKFRLVETNDHVHVTLFTSGTTADPKGAQLTSANLLFNAQAIKKWLRITDTDRFAAILPLHHINSTTFSLATLLAGGTLVLISEPPKKRFWEIMAANRVTITSIVQRILYELLELQKEFEEVRNDLVLSRIQIGSDVVNPDSALRFIEQYGIPLHQGYGLTEIALRATGVPMDLARDDYLELVRRNTIGMALENVNVAILNEDGHEVEPGEGNIGEICIRGPIVMQGYLKNAEATAAVLEGGWFHSGDMGWYEDLPQGRFFFFHSRAKEIIKKGAALVSPAAIDRSVTAAFPELAEAFAIGYPDHRWGEEIWMVVIFKENVGPKQRKELIEEIVKLGREERIPGLPKFESPSHVLDFEVEFPGKTIPRTSTMKAQRARLKDMVVARLPPDEITGEWMTEDR